LIHRTRLVDEPLSRVGFDQPRDVRDMIRHYLPAIHRV